MRLVVRGLQLDLLDARVATVLDRLQSARGSERLRWLFGFGARRGLVTDDANVVAFGVGGLFSDDLFDDHGGSPLAEDGAVVINMQLLKFDDLQELILFDNSEPGLLQVEIQNPDGFAAGMPSPVVTAELAGRLLLHFERRVGVIG